MPQTCHRNARKLAALAVFACAFGQLSSVAHFALVEHTVCAAHGDLIHGAASHAHRIAADVPVVEAQDVGHAHDACPLAIAGHATPAPTARVLCTPPAGHLAVAGARAPPSAVAPAIDPLHLAPKSSPPAV